MGEHTLIPYLDAYFCTYGAICSIKPIYNTSYYNKKEPDISLIPNWFLCLEIVVLLGVKVS